MPIEVTPEYAKALYEHAAKMHQSQDLVYAIPLLERVSQLNDPFYSPFALSLLAQSYHKIKREDLEAEVLKRVTALPEDHQVVLNPRWLAFCYERTGNVKMAAVVLLKCIRINPIDPWLNASLAEIYVLDGRLDDAVAIGQDVIQSPEVKFQIVARMIRGFAFALADKHEQSAKEFLWVAQFLISGKTTPPETWDYQDLNPLVSKLGPNTRAADLLISVLSGHSTIQEFIRAWNDMPANRAPL
jgi:tetratricopeptide (TPR) repeat protein